ncbi:hypothetical protein H6Y62_11875 [Staphylococcus lugdunensis]|uniref:Uncharacterized protein n=2 Tax=Staphylococcus lugdunensis TaxID=28035 RepID=A0A4V2KV77_STALU|nr:MULTISPECIES: hypothetical protein [Staphylococcus]AMG61528.1 hypothetical protein AL499_06115 [Staphylococcus lugdunensis]MCH8650331.1 hypothetical protein [Staphylococcus lugdunensis]MCH8655024.1 hypothetical protein [Staphylococcus lugdunensis]MCH8662284.1 hypothetical protein [Staphylococcus lugdunensis]MCH8683665.1 hypothetical protein [Staphylococcus lugdunensis]
MKEQDKLRMGPQQRAFEKKANGQSELGWGPNRKNFEKKFIKQSKLGWLKLFSKKASQQYKLLNITKKHKDDLK